MGNLLSNKKLYENNTEYIICDAERLQKRLHKHRNNSKIIDIFEKTPIACNYKYDISNNVAETDCFSNYYECQRPLYFQLGSLIFCPGCKIVLEKELYKKIIELEKSHTFVPFSNEDYKKVIKWRCYNNFFS